MPSLAGFDNFIQSQNAQPTGLGTTPRMAPPPGNLNIDQLIDEISPQYGIDPAVTRALVKLESGGNPRAMPIDPVTKQPLSSAKGLMQLIDGTAHAMGVQDPFDPAQNLHGGLKYLKQHLDSTGGDLDKALRMYNQGPKGPLHMADDYVSKFRKFYGKEFTTPSTSSVDIGAALKGVLGEGRQVAQSGPSPSMPTLDVAPIVPDTTIDLGGTALGRGVDKAYTLTPENTPQLGKLPFGVENKGGTVEQTVKDIAYGIPEGAASLASMAIGMVPATAAGLSAFGAAGTPETGAFSDTSPPSMQDTLVEGKERFDKVMGATTMAPQTATGKYIMRPFEVAIGAIYNTHDEVVRDLNPGASPEELEKKFKAGHFVLDVLGAGAMAKGTFRGKLGEKPVPIKVEDVEAAKAEVLANPEVAPEVKAQVDSVTPDLIQTLQQKVAQSEAKARVEKAGIPTAKIPENQSIVEGLMIEAETRTDSNGKGTLNKAAKIVAELDQDAALVDFAPIRGIRVKGTTGKTIARLIEERDAQRKVTEKDAAGVGEDVPIGETPPVVEPVKSLSEIPDVKSQAEATMYGKSEKVLPAGDMPLDSASVASLKGVEPESYGRLSSFFDDNSYEPLNEFVKLIRESELEGEVLERMARITGAPVESLTKGAIKIGHGTTKNLVLSLIEEKRRGLLEKKVEEPVMETPAPEVDLQSLAESIDPDLRYIKSQEGIPGIVDDAHQFSVKIPGSDKETGVTMLGEVTPEKLQAAKDKILEGYKEKVEEAPVEVPKVGEELLISEFDTTAKAKQEGYTFPDKAHYASLERAQAKAQELGEGHEVVKVKGKYKVAKFQETPEVKEFGSVEEANRAGHSVMSEIPEDRLRFESPSTDPGYGIGKIEGKYYRLGPEVEAPTRRRSIAPADVSDMVGDGVSMSDYQALLKFTDEATLREMGARDRVKELTPMVKAEEGKPVDPALLAEFQDRYKQWKDSYVTKCNIAKPSKKGKKVTKESLAPINDNFKTFKNMEDAQEWMEKTGASGELMADPLTGKVSFIKEDAFKDLGDVDIWDEGVEQLTGRSERLLDEEAYPDMEMSETGTRDLWSILNNERGSIEIPSDDGIKRIFKSATEIFKDKLKGEFIDRTTDTTTITHPAVYSGRFIPLFADLANKFKARTVLDPFGGVGTIGKIKENGFTGKIIANELEPEWAGLHKINGVDESIVGDARKMSNIPTGEIDMIITSPAYGNFLAAPRNKGKLDTLTYENSLGRKVTEGNAGRLWWGDKYRVLHNEAYKEFYRVVKPGGTAIINMKDFIRDGKTVPVTDFHIKAMEDAGFKLVERQQVKVPGLATGKINRPKVESEDILVFQKPENGKGRYNPLGNERGSVEVPDARALIDLVNSTMAKAKKMGKSIDEYLDFIGADQATIDMFKAAIAQVPQMKQDLREKDPTGTAIFYPEGKVVAQTIIRNKNKEVKSVGPPITETLANKVMSADRGLQWGSDHMRKDPETGRVRVEHTSNGFDRAMQATEVKINSFRAAGLQELYSQWRDAKSAAEREKVQVKEWLDGLEKQIAPERREAFAIAAYADMKSVKEALTSMGITEIPKLTPKESAVLEQLLDYTRKFRDRSNFVRTHTGQKAIPKLLDMNGRENYLPLMRDLNVLRDMGLTEGLTISDSKKLGELSKKFNGMWNPNSKKRNVSDIPIELDPFKALRKHAEYGLDEIHISPVAALAKDLANLKLPRVDGVKGKMPLSDWNPYLSRMLSRWSDQIVGKDVVATAMANANPFFSWAKDRIAKNLVVATIGGSLRTVLVQPTSYIIGIPTMTDLRSTGYGIWKLMSERPFGKSNARQHSSVLNIREADYNFKELAEYIQQGKMSGTMGYLAEKSLAPMKWVDSIMAEAGWNAARYYGEKRLKLQGQELYRFADDVVERTQGLGIKGAVSDIQSSAATKWLTLLQTFAIADFNLIARDVLGIKNPEMNQSKTIIRVAKYTAATILAGQLYKMIGLDNVVPDPIGAYEEAKKEGKGDLKAVGSAAGELLEKVPIIGGSAKYGSSLFGIAGEWADILPEAGEKFSASLDWNKLTPKQKSYNIRLIARAAGLTMGIPMTNQILKSINSHYKGGDPWEIILGVYKEEKKRKGGLRPEIPRPPQPPRPF